MSALAEQRESRPSPAEVRDLARQLRADSIRCTTAAGSGHPTSSLSAADLMAALFAWHLHYDWDNPKRADNDRLVFSKGHASPLLYALFKQVGVVSDQELMETYRRAGSRLQGHPTPILPWVDVATGSLGQGLPAGVGMALAGKYLDELDYRVWVLCGDSETAEGSVWESLDKAAHYGLSNLTVIVDVNRLGQNGPTELEWDLASYVRRVEAFGCLALTIDGHDVEQIDHAYDAAERAGRPTVILARTIKGKGVPALEDKVGWHGKPIPADIADEAVRALGGARDLRVVTPPRAPQSTAYRGDSGAGVELPSYAIGDKVATRKAFGDALAALGARAEVVVIDGEVGNSTFTDEFGKRYPERFFEMFISEMQMIGTAVGLSARGYVPFAATFAAFMSRAYDFIRMAAISQADIRLCGSHAGVEIGEDGPSQMGLEDIAALRAVHGSTVLYPSDATSAAVLTKEMADTAGVVYLRTTRGAWPVLYGPDETFVVGGSKVPRRSDEDHVLLIGAGVTVHSCLAAAETLAQEGIAARVMDLYSVKPIDTAAVGREAAAVGGRLVVVEDHYPEGGLGEAVLAALAEAGQAHAMAHLAVRALPGSGTPKELMAAAGISADHVAAAARQLLEDR